MQHDEPSGELSKTSGISDPNEIAQRQEQYRALEDFDTDRLTKFTQSYSRTEVLMTSVYSRLLARLRRSWLAPVVGGLASFVSFRWVRKPVISDGDQLCLFVTYAPRGKIPNHALFHARAWTQAGFKVNLTVVLDNLDSFDMSSDLDFAAGILLRANQGYDFGAWAATITQLSELNKADLICLANDSVYGPSKDFPAMINRVKGSDFDIIGLTESFERRHHFQSYIMFFTRGAIVNPAFLKFWRKVKTGGRTFVIANYELKLLNRMEKAGLRAQVLYPAGERGCNPTLEFWRELIMAGFPFLKVQLLRENPFQADLTGWERLVEERGFDLKLIREHLNTFKNSI